jgi:hypothetical protein
MLYQNLQDVLDIEQIRIYLRNISSNRVLPAEGPIRDKHQEKENLMSAVLAFTAPIHRPIEPDYIDEPCSSTGNVRGSGQISNVTYVNFLPAAEPQTRLRITKRGRRLLVAVVALPLVIGALVAAINSGGAVATAEGTSTDFTYVTMAQGESLWQLAQEIAPNADPRDVIAEIVSLNQIQGEVQAGQKIAIPVGY